MLNFEATERNRAEKKLYMHCITHKYILSNMDVQIHFAVPHSGVTRHVRMLYYLKNGLIFSIKSIFLKVYCKFYYLYMGFFLLV